MATPQTEAKPADQDALVADIDRTRAELARTIEAISDRLSPRNNVRRATDQIRERVRQIAPRPPQAQVIRREGRNLDRQPALLVSSSYSAGESRSGGRAASPLLSWPTFTRNIQPAVYGSALPREGSSSSSVLTSVTSPSTGE